MKSLATIFSLPGLFQISSAQYDPNYAKGHSGIIHLFEWDWPTIADECEIFLGPKKVGGVQISPPTENVIVSNPQEGDRPWWERYQPISYNFETRSGTKKQLKDMIQRCNDVGVRIYPDAVINHMCGGERGDGVGTGGTFFNATAQEFPDVPYDIDDFNDDICTTSSGNIENYYDPLQVRNCRLVNLLDLDQSFGHTRKKIIHMMNQLIDFGVAGFRVDACKHMWPEDLEYIFGELNDVNEEVGGGRPYIFQEVLVSPGEPITGDQYFEAGSVTEFAYGYKIGESINSLYSLETFGEAWGVMPSKYSLIFLCNHDNERGHGGGDGLITFRDPYDYKIATVFMMAWPYGTKRIMSSYYFVDTEAGPPALTRGLPDDEPLATSCTNDWVCQHRWKAISAIFEFAAVVEGTEVNNWWDNGGNQIAFTRGDVGFVAINKDATTLTGTIPTGLKPGNYICQLTGKSFTVDSSGLIEIIGLSNKDDQNMIILFEGGLEPNFPPEPETPDDPDDPDIPGTCNVANKIDCGYMGIDRVECERKGCCWVEIPGDPWCYYRQENIL